MRLIPEWRLAHKLWSIRIALAWAAFEGLHAAWPAFMDTVPPRAFAVVSMLFGVVTIAARLTHQPGIEK